MRFSWDGCRRIAGRFEVVVHHYNDDPRPIDVAFVTGFAERIEDRFWGSSSWTSQQKWAFSGAACLDLTHDQERSSAPQLSGCVEVALLEWHHQSFAAPAAMRPSVAMFPVRLIGGRTVATRSGSDDTGDHAVRLRAIASELR